MVCPVLVGTLKKSNNNKAEYLVGLSNKVCQFKPRANGLPLLSNAFGQSVHTTRGLVSKETSASVGK